MYMTYIWEVPASSETDLTNKLQQVDCYHLPWWLGRLHLPHYLHVDETRKSGSIQLKLWERRGHTQTGKHTKNELERSTIFSWENSLFLWWFSIVMWNYQGVNPSAIRGLGKARVSCGALGASTQEFLSLIDRMVDTMIPAARKWWARRWMEMWLQQPIECGVPYKD